MAMEMDFKNDPQVRQYNLQNRWFWKKNNYMLHAGLSFLKEDRTSGQTNHSHHLAAGATPYRINIGTNRYEGVYEACLYTQRKTRH